MNLTIDEIRFISSVIHRAQRIIELVVVCALLCDACGRLAGFFLSPSSSSPSRFVNLHPTLFPIVFVGE